MISKHTLPERLVQIILALNKISFSCHIKNLPGTPDIVIYDKKIIINVKGCFWHNHKCWKSKIPKKNRKFWINKFNKIFHSDTSNRIKLQRQGWRVIDIWECSLIEESIDNTKAYILREINLN